MTNVPQTIPAWYKEKFLKALTDAEEQEYIKNINLSDRPASAYILNTGGREALYWAWHKYYLEKMADIEVDLTVDDAAPDYAYYK